MFESRSSASTSLALRCHTGGAEEVTVSGDTVGDAFSVLDHEHPGVLGRVLEPGSAAPRAGYRIFLGSQNIMVLQGLGFAHRDRGSRQHRRPGRPLQLKVGQTVPGSLA